MGKDYYESQIGRVIAFDHIILDKYPGSSEAPPKQAFEYWVWVPKKHNSREYIKKNMLVIARDEKDARMIIHEKVGMGYSSELKGINCGDYLIEFE